MREYLGSLKVPKTHEAVFGILKKATFIQENNIKSSFDKINEKFAEDFKNVSQIKTFCENAETSISKFKKDLKRFKKIQQDDMPMVADLDESDLEDMKQEYLT